MKKTIIWFVYPAIMALLALLVFSVSASAQTLPSTASTWCYSTGWNTNLQVGSTGPDVVALRTALGINLNLTQKDNPNFDEELASHVVAFQEKYASTILSPYGITRGTGYVGRATRAVLNSQYNCSIEGGQNASPLTITAPANLTTWEKGSQQKVRWSKIPEFDPHTKVIVVLAETGGTGMWNIGENKDGYFSYLGSYTEDGFDGVKVKVPKDTIDVQYALLLKRADDNNNDLTDNADLSQPIRIRITSGTTNSGISCYSWNTNLGLGSTGADVVALQDWLIAKGFDIPAVRTGAVSKGYYGMGTAAAVARYQLSVGIEAQGFFGPLTRASVHASCSQGNTALIVCPVGYMCTPSQSGSASNVPGCPLGYRCTSVVTDAPQITLISKSITKNSTASQKGYSTTTINAVFTVNIRAVGGDYTFGGYWTNPPFVKFDVLKNGMSAPGDIIQPSVIYQVPSSGVITAGLPGGSFKLQENNEVRMNIEYIFVPRTSGSYAVRLDRISWTKDSGSQSGTTFTNSGEYRTSAITADTSVPWYPTSDSSQVTGTVSLVGANEDKVMKWNSQGYIHGPDWKWAINLTNNGSVTKYIKKMVLVHNTVGEGWSTDSSASNPVGKSLYILGATQSQCSDCTVFNHQTDNMNWSIAPNGGTRNMYAYGYPSSQAFSGGYLLVEFTDGTSSRISIAASTLRPSLTTVVQSALPYLTQTIKPSRSLISSGQSVTFALTYPTNTVKSTLRIVCPSGVGGTDSFCNSTVDVTGKSEFNVTLNNTTAQSQNVVPNYYIYTSDNPTFAKGVTTQVTVLAPAESPTLSPSSFTKTIQLGQSISQVFVVDNIPALKNGLWSTWIVGKGELPSGLSLKQYGAFSGVLSGTPTAAGTYSFTVDGINSTDDLFAHAWVYLTVTAPVAQTTLDPMSVQVALPVAPFATTFTVGQRVAFRSSTPTNISAYPVTYTWDFGDGSTANSSSNTTNGAVYHVYSTTGQYTVKLRASDASGRTSNVAETTIMIYPQPVQSEVPSQTTPTPTPAPTPVIQTPQTVTPSSSSIKSGDTVTLSLSYPSNTSRATLRIVCPSGVTAVDNSCNSTVDVTGRTSYPVALTNNTGQTQNVVPNYYIYTSDNPTFAKGVSANVSVSASTAAAASSLPLEVSIAFPPMNTFPTGQIIRFYPSTPTNVSAFPVRFDWSFGDGTTGTSRTDASTSVSHSYQTAGEYVVKMQAVDANGKTSAVVEKKMTITAPTVSATEGTAAMQASVWSSIWKYFVQ